MIKRNLFNANNNVKKWNKLFLGLFLIIVCSTIIIRLASSSLKDLGYFNGELHIDFRNNPRDSFNEEFLSFIKTNSLPKSHDSWNKFLDKNPYLKEIIHDGPSFFWTFTQFTWLTTIILFLFLIFRFFKFDSKAPRWLNWIMSQKTLTLMTIYELVISSFFWSTYFLENSIILNSQIQKIEFSITILVHAIIPFLLIIYSLIFLILDDKACILREFLLIKGLFYPFLYMFYYILLTMIWNDPYPITKLHNVLTNNHDNEMINNHNWEGWAKNLYKLPIALLGIYIVMGISTIFHNLILLKFNKKYDPEKDHENLRTHKYLMYKLERKLFKKSYGKGWKTKWEQIKYY